MALSKRGKLTLKVSLVVLAIAAVIGVAVYFIVSSLATYKKVTLQYGDGRTVVYSVREDGKFGIPAENDREGYAFDNWYVDQGCTVPYDFDTEVSDDITIYAKWTPVNSINFYLNNGTDEVFKSYENQDYDRPFAIPSSEPVRERYIFLGWSTTPELSSSNILYKFGTTNRAFDIPLNGISLYAIWARDEVTLKYDFGIGTINGRKSETIVLDRNTEHSILDLVPECSGHTFLGWSEDINYVPGESVLYQSENLNIEGGVNPINRKIITTRSTTLYAVYRRHTVTLRFFSNTVDTVTGEVPDLIASYNQPILIPDVVYERDGYGLYAWSTDPNFDIGKDEGLIYTPGEDWFTYGDSYADKDVVELYAIWVVRKIDLTFDFGDGIGVLNGIPYGHTEYTAEVQYNTEYTVPMFTVRYDVDGAFFAGFCAVLTDDPITGEPRRTDVFYAGDTIFLRGDMVLVAPDGTLSIVIEACYSNSVTFEVNYELNGGLTAGGVGAIPTTYVIYPPMTGGTTKITLQDLVKKGHTFVGWTTVNGREGTKVEDADQYMPGVQYDVNRNITLYAYFVPYEYEVEYHGNGETNGYTVDRRTYYYDETIQLASCGFQKNGYTFVGWATTPGGEAKYKQGENFSYLLREGENPEFILGLYPNGTTLHFYAVWEIKSYTVTFSEGEGYKLSVATGSTNPVPYGNDFTFKFEFETGYDKAGANIYVNGILVTLHDWTYTITNVDKNYTVSVDGVRINTFTVTLPERDEFIAEPYGSSVGVVNIGYGHSYQFRIRLEEPYTKSSIVVKTEGSDGTIATLTPVAGVYIIENIIFDQVVTVEGVERNTYTITLVGGTGYILEAFDGASTTVRHGESFAFKFVLDERYNLSPFVLHVNGAEVVTHEQVAGDALSHLGFLEDIRNDKTITVTGVRINTYTVSLASGEGYTLTAKSGSTSPCDHGTSYTFKFALDVAYSNSPYVIYVNGTAVALNADKEYTITNITKNINVTVTGVEKNRYDVTLPTAAEQVGYSIYAESATNVEYGSNLTIVFALGVQYTKSNYSVKINGTEVTLNAQGKYVITNITENKTVTVSGVTMNTYTVEYPAVMNQYGYTLNVWTGNPSPLYYGNSFIFSFSVNVGFDERDVKVYIIKYDDDGNEVSKTDVFSAIKAGGGQYTISNIVNDIKIEIDGITVVEWDINFTETPRGYEVKYIDGYTNRRPSGTNFEFVIELDEAYAFSIPVVFVNNIQKLPIEKICTVGGVSAVRDVYVVENIIEDQFIVISGVDINTYQISIPTGQGYTITPVSGYDPTRVEHGDDFKFKVTLDEAYAASITNLVVRVNGTQITPVTGIYTIENVEGGKAISIDGLAVNKYTITFPDSALISEYFDEFSTAQAMEVDWGASFTFTVKLKAKYSASDISIKANGTEVLYSGTTTRTCVITSVKANQTISVSGMTINKYQISLQIGDGYVTNYMPGTESQMEHGKEAKFYYYVLPTYNKDGAIVRVNGTVVDVKNVTSVPDLGLTILPNTWEVEIAGSTQTCEGYIFTINSIEKRYQLNIAGVTEQVNLVNFQSGTGYAFVDEAGDPLTYVELPKDLITGGGNDCIKFKVTLDVKYNKSTVKVISADEITFMEQELIADADGYYSMIDVSHPYLITVEGVVINTYTLTFPTTTEGYDIEVRPGYTNPVEHGQGYNFVVKLETAYSKSAVKVYTEEVDSGTRKEIVPASGIYIIRNVTEDLKVHIEGVEKNTYTIKLPTGAEQIGYTIKASTGYSSPVIHAGSYGFEFELLEGYTDSNFIISLNGTPLGKTDLTDGKYYVINDIQDNQIITVRDVKLNTYVIDIPTGTGYTISVYNGVGNSVTHGNNFNFVINFEDAYKESANNVKIYVQPTDESSPRVEITKASGFYTIPTVTMPYKITVEGVEVSKFNITLPPDGEGYAVAAFNNQETEVTYGESFSFTVVLEEAYSDSPVLVKANGVFVSPDTPGGTLYTISNIREHKSITVEGVKKNQYRITLITGPGYTFAPISASYDVDFDASYEFRVSLLEGYTNSAYTVRYRTTGGTDDTTLNITDGRYLLSNIKSHKEIYVINVSLNTYTVTYPQDINQGFTITPYDGQSTTVTHGTDFRFTITLDAKFDRSEYKVKANGVEISAAGGVYVLSSVREDKDIEVLNITVNTYNITFPARQEGYKIEAVSGFSSPVVYGGNFQFAFTLEEAYSDSRGVLIIRINGAAVSLTNDKYEIIDIQEDKEITVSGVTKNLYEITLTPGEGYTLIPQSGSESPVEWGGSFAFKINLKAEYNQSEYDVLVNNVSVKDQLISGGFTITDIKQAQTVTVTGVTRNVYTITFPTVTDGYELTSITNINNKATHGSDFSFKVKLLDAYSESRISVKANGISLFEQDGKFTITDIQADQTVSITGVEMNIYDVVLRSGEGYTLTAKSGSSSPVNYGDNFTFVFSLLEGYTKSNYIVYVDGAAITLNADNEFEIQTIRADKEVTVEGVELNKYTVKLPTTQTGYSIGPATGSSSPVLYNKQYTFTLSLNTAYNKSTPVVKVNGENVVLNDWQYTIRNIKEDIVVEVEGVTINTYQVNIPEIGVQTGYSLRAKAGSTSPVEYGKSYSFTFELDAAYDRSSYTVKVNGTPVGITNNEYTIQNIRADQTVTVENVTLNQYSISLPVHQTGYTLVPYDGSASPVDHGGVFKIKFTILEGYTQSLATYKVKLDGADIKSYLTVDGIYTISNITNDHTFTVEGVSINKYNVRYNYYVGTTATSKDLTINHGADVPLGDIPNPNGRTGHNFTGWSSDSTNITSDKVIDAGYVIKTYIITWSAETADGGSNTWDHRTHFNTSDEKKATTTAIYNRMYGELGGGLVEYLITPIRTGYEFKGWFTQNIGGEEITKVTGVPDLPGNTTFYAQWIATNINIQLNRNGGEGTLPVINAISIQGETINIGQGGLTRSRYTFDGWSLDQNATEGTDQYKVDINDAAFNGQDYTVTLYAIWIRDTVTITFDPNGGTNPPAATKVNTYESLILTDGFKAERSGLTFYGWCADPDGAGIIYSKDFTAYTSIPVENSNLTMYAIWSYSIVYHKNFPGDDEITTKYSVVNKNYQLESVYTINYYTFIGWATSPSGDIAYSDKHTFEPLGNHLELYAVWISGYGTESVPFEIGTNKEWNYVVVHYAKDDTIFYKQVQNLVESSVGELTRIEEFAGNYDGNNKYIKKFNSCAPFETVMATATVANLEVQASNIVFDSFAYFGGICINLYGTLDNCKYLVDTELNVSSIFYCGGLTAIAYDGSEIKNSSNSAQIKVNGKNESHIGGLAGYVSGGLDITNSTNTGKLIATSTYGNAHHVYIGGAIGYIATTATVNVNIFTNEGEITSTDCVSDIGGVIGYVYNSSILTADQIINKGAISTTAPTSHNVAGIIGEIGTGVMVTLTNAKNEAKIYANSASGTFIIRAAGIVGHAGNTTELTIEKAGNKGEIDASSSNYIYLGGILGENEGKTTITEAYNMADVHRTTGKTGSYGYLGGLFGRIWHNSTVTKSFNVGNITSDFTSGPAFMGGLGAGTGNAFTLTDAYNTGNINGEVKYTGTSEAVMMIGGLVGTFSAGTIKNSYNSGYVKAIGTTGVTAGGLFGSVESIDIKNSYNFANVYGEMKRTTENSADVKPYSIKLGGILGASNISTTLGYVYNAGAINYKVGHLAFQNHYVGGIAGYYNGTQPTGSNVGWANDVSGDIRSAVRSDTVNTVLSGTGMAQKTIMDTLKNPSNSIYSTWNLSTWNTESNKNNGLPMLKIYNEVAYVSTAIFNNNISGSSSSVEAYVPTGKSVIMPSYQFTREGYTLIGWTKTSGGTVAEYDTNEAVTLTATTTFYAVWAKGNGTTTYPYEISSRTLWNEFVYNKAIVPNKYYKQTASFSGKAGSNSNLLQVWDFYGVYDGGGFTITLDSDSLGLFKGIKTGATVKSLNVIHSGNIGLYHSYSNVGGNKYYWNRSGGFAGELNGSIDNCTWSVKNLTSSFYNFGMVGVAENGSMITNSTVTYDATSFKPSTSDAVFGGIVGRANGSVIISNCKVKGAINITSISASARVGGIVGMSTGTTTISNCGNLAKITAPATSSSYAGGIVGYVSEGSISITGSYNSGEVSASAATTSPYAGGLVGYAVVSTTISNCYNAGYIDSAATTKIAYAGGLVGNSEGALTILNAYNIGTVSASATSANTAAGGLVGASTGYTIKDSYNTGSIMATSNATAYIAGVIGYQDLKTSTTLSNVYGAGSISSNSKSRKFGGIVGYMGGSSTFNVSKTYWSDEIITSVDSSGYAYTAYFSSSAEAQTGAESMYYEEIYYNIKDRNSPFYTTNVTTAWDFVNTWKSNTIYNSAIPYLSITDETAAFTMPITLIDNTCGNPQTTHYISYNGSYIVVDTTFAKVGYTFAGWASTDGGMISYLNHQPVINVNKTLSLYSVWYVGDGTAANPYQIRDTDTWEKFVVEKGATEGLYYLQVADLTKNDKNSGYISTVPVFSGNYDGGNYKISMSDFVTPPFNVVRGTISNLVIENKASLRTTSATNEDQLYGTLATTLEGGTISNCTVKGTITLPYANKDNAAYVGGLVGKVKGTGNTITKSQNNAEITISGNSVKIIGGLVGGLDPDTVTELTISESINLGNITVSTGPYYSFVGGLVGGIERTANNAKSITISNSYNIGTINVMSTGIQSVGGLVGSLQDTGHNSSSSIANSYNAAFVTTSTSKATYLGGLIGQSDKVTVANSFNIGKVYGYIDSSIAINIGGLVGFAYNNKDANKIVITKSYNAGMVNFSTSGMGDAAGGLVGELINPTNYYDIGTTNYYANNIGNVDARTKAVGANGASVTTNTANFNQLLTKLKNFTSDPLYSGAWSSSIWKTQSLYNNDLPYFVGHTNAMFSITVSFANNNSTGSMTARHLYENSMFITPECTGFTPSVGGATFMGWATIEDSEDMEYLEGALVKGLTENTTLYPVFG